MANFFGAYTFLCQHLSSVNNLNTVEYHLVPKLSKYVMDHTTIKYMDQRRVDKPTEYGSFLNSFRCPAFPIIQQLMVNAHAKPPVIDHFVVGHVMKKIEGAARRVHGCRLLEWPISILQHLTLRRYNEEKHVKWSQDPSDTSDTDENGSDKPDEDEQGADAAVQMEETREPGNYAKNISKNSSYQEIGHI